MSKHLQISINTQIISFDRVSRIFSDVGYTCYKMSAEAAYAKMIESKFKKMIAKSYKYAGRRRIDVLYWRHYCHIYQAYIDPSMRKCIRDLINFLYLNYLISDRDARTWFATVS